MYTRMCMSWLVLVLLSLQLFSGSQATAQELHNQPTGSNESKKLNILMISDDFMGHVGKLLGLGEQLAQRGHNVTYFLSLQESDQERYKSLLEKHGIHLWNVSAKSLHSVDKNLFKPKFNLTKAAAEYGRHLATLSKITIKHLNKSLSNRQWDFVIAHDHFHSLSAFACLQSLHKFPLVYVGTLPMMVHLLPTWPWPNVMHGASSDNFSFKDRMLNTIHGLSYEVFFKASSAEVNKYCPSITINEALSQIGVTTPYMVPTVVGFEYPTTVTPLIEYTGPLIAQAASAPLTGELKEWLTDKPERSVVYISMGSLHALDEKGGQAFLEGVMNTNFSLLWSLRRSNQWILEGLDVDLDRVLISDWTPQFSVLGSEAIHSAILHGGFNGLNEALWNGVPVVVVPQQPEQLYNAGRVHFNDLGIYLDHDTLTSSKITESLKALDTGEYRSKVAKLQKVMRMAGGAKRAADLVEFYEDVGYSHLVPAYAKYQWSWVQYYNADVYALMVLILVIVVVCLKTCCKYICKRCCSHNKKEKKD